MQEAQQQSSKKGEWASNGLLHCPLELQIFLSPRSVKETLQTEQLLNTEAFQSYMGNPMQGSGRLHTVSALKKILLMR